MDVRYFVRRLAIYLLVFTILSLLLGPLFLGGYTFYKLTISLFFEGVLLLIFGGCLGTSLVEGCPTMRYRVNPAVTRIPDSTSPDAPANRRQAVSSS